MVLPLIGAIVAALGVASVAVAIEQLIQPASLFAAFVIGLVAYIQFGDRLPFDLGSDVRNEIVRILAAVFVGVLVYRVFAAVLLGVSGLTALVIVALFFIGGVPLVVGLFSELGERLI